MRGHVAALTHKSDYEESSAKFSSMKLLSNHARVAGRSRFLYDTQRLMPIPKGATSHACFADKSHRGPSAYRSSE